MQNLNLYLDEVNEYLGAKFSWQKFFTGLIPNKNGSCLIKASNCVFPFKDDNDDTHTDKCSKAPHGNGEGIYILLSQILILF